jgi:two-component system cell cycle response regulator
MEVESRVDALTGLYNRKYMDDATHILMKQTKESGARIAFALIDVDHFKLINDTFGHGAGDLVLKVIAEKIRKNVRITDPCIRYGGEEFCIIFSDFVRRDGTLLNSGSGEFSDAVQNVIKRLKDEIGETTITWEGKPIHVTVSIGVTFLSAGTKEWDAGELLREADQMLYEAKRSGRNQIFVHFHQN